MLFCINNECEILCDLYFSKILHDVSGNIGFPSAGVDYKLIK